MGLCGGKWVESREQLSLASDVMERKCLSPAEDSAAEGF
jgi:hypothetical protein